MVTKLSAHAGSPLPCGSSKPEIASDFDLPCVREERGRGRSLRLRPRDRSVIVRQPEKPEVVRDHSDDERRRACTDVASVSRADVVISMSMQASVTD